MCHVIFSWRCILCLPVIAYLYPKYTISRSRPSGNNGDTSDWEHHISQHFGRLVVDNFIASSCKLTMHTHHCSISCLILCGWYLFIKLYKSYINIVSRHEEKEKSTEQKMVSKARIQVLTSLGFKNVFFQGVIDVSCYLSTSPLSQNYRQLCYWHFSYIFKLCRLDAY